MEGALEESWLYLVLINKQYVVSTFSLIFFFVFLGRKRKSLVGNIIRGRHGSVNLIVPLKLNRSIGFWFVIYINKKSNYQHS